MSSLEHLTDNSQSERNFQRLWRYIKSATQREATHYIGGGGTNDAAFAGTWVHYDTGLTTPSTGRDAGYYKHQGRVYLTGVIKNGTAGTAAWTMPVGYRPRTGTDANFIVYAATAPGSLNVSSAGVVTPANFLAGSNVATFTILDGLSYQVER